MHCSVRDFEEARLLQRKLRELFQSAQPGTPNAESLTEVRRLCDRALVTVDDEDCQQQICEVERHATQLFSTAGAMLQQRLVLDALESICDRLASLQGLESAAARFQTSETTLEKR